MNDDSYYQLANQPLLFVLAEFRFTEIMSMDKYFPDIQDIMRQTFPFFEEQTLQEVNVSPDGMQMNQSKQWVFIGKNKKNAVLLNHKRLVFITSNYERFDGFREYCEIALEALITVAKPSLLTRIGLRYSNLITAADSADITQYVQSNVCNESNLKGVGHPVRQMNETVLETDEGNMVVRSMYANTDVSVFHDLGNIPIKVATQNQPSQRILLDFDHFWQPNLDGESTGDDIDSLDFEKDIIIEKLEKMHKLNRQAFWDITTDSGKEVWK